MQVVAPPPWESVNSLGHPTADSCAGTYAHPPATPPPPLYLINWNGLINLRCPVASGYNCANSTSPNVAMSDVGVKQIFVAFYTGLCLDPTVSQEGRLDTPASKLAVNIAATTYLHYLQYFISF